MFTQTFDSNGYTGAVRTRNRKTPITEALYKAWLREAYPDIQTAELAIVGLPSLPVLPKADDPLAEVKRATFDERNIAWNKAFEAVAIQHEYGLALRDLMDRWVKVAARLIGTGDAYPLDNDCRMDKPTVLQAFVDYQNEHEFWQAAEAAIAELDKPITDVATRPPETLSEAEQADPLSAASAKSRKKR